MLAVGFGEDGVTLTVTDCDPVPPVPVHASVKVLEPSARTERISLPAVALAPSHPLEAEQDVALVLLQVSVTLLPLAIVIAFAVRLTVGIVV